MNPQDGAEALSSYADSEGDSQKEHGKPVAEPFWPLPAGLGDTLILDARKPRTDSPTTDAVEIVRGDYADGAERCIELNRQTTCVACGTPVLIGDATEVPNSDTHLCPDCAAPRRQTCPQCGYDDYEIVSGIEYHCGACGHVWEGEPVPEDEEA